MNRQICLNLFQLLSQIFNLSHFERNGVAQIKNMDKVEI